MQRKSHPKKKKQEKKRKDRIKPNPKKTTNTFLKKTEFLTITKACQQW
jgi:hypothetical protein